MKPTVMNSYEDDSGQRCVDILKNADGSFSWAECHRDPEDASGWSTLSTSKSFASEEAALNDAYGSVGWLTEQRAG